MGDPERLRRALAAIDAANGEDPARIRIGGEERPKELAHAELASDWVLRLRPEASEALRLAARAHHLRRWEIPRSSQPEGASGYHRWRRALQRHHAERVGEILEREGYDVGTIARVQALVQKRGLGSDDEVQALEDALCLVFLETQLGDLSGRLEAEKMVDVLRKTASKMSPPAVEHARGLCLDGEARELLRRAIGG